MHNSRDRLHEQRVAHRGDDRQHPCRLRGVEPFNLYGTTETLFAGDCEHHQGLHVFEDLALVEVVDDDNSPVRDGVVGTKLLVTSFIKRSQPLLRFELSDMAALDTAPCPCGRPLARMVSVEGRSDDIVHLDGGGGRTVAVHPLTLRSPMAALPKACASTRSCTIARAFTCWWPCATVSQLTKPRGGSTPRCVPNSRAPASPTPGST